MNNNRATAVLMLLSFAAGIAIGTLYMKSSAAEEESSMRTLIDTIIGEWTGVPADQSVNPSDTLFIAQVSSKRELPMARLGFFPDTVRSLAAMVQERYGVPSAVTLAQWALESGFGTRNLGASNYFGHTFAATKRFIAKPEFVVRRDVVSVNGELVPGAPRKFTSYKNIVECFDVHGRYLSGSDLYKAAFLTSTSENFARVIAMRYAQDPNYALKLITIIRRYKLA